MQRDQSGVIAFHLISFRCRLALYRECNNCKCKLCIFAYKAYDPVMKPDSKPLATTVRHTSIGRMLTMLSMSVKDQLNNRLSALGLSMNGFFILMTLLEKEGQTQSDIGQKIALPAYGTTRTIDTLQDHGLLERRADPASRRNHLIYLTPKGRALAPEIFAVVKEVNEWLLAPLDAAEKQHFSDVLEKLTLAHLLKNKK